MKKVVFTFMIGGALLASSCSSESKEEKHDGHEHSEQHEDAQDHGSHEGHDHADHEEEEQANFPVDGYDFYGMAEVIPSKALTVEEMVTKVYAEGSFDGNVTAVLDGVCKKQGCWVTMTNKSGESVRVRFKDHSFGVPTDTPVGTEVVLRGFAKMDTTTIDLQKHYLDDAKEAGQEVTQEQYDEITEDLIEISFISDGILVKK